MKYVLLSFALIAVSLSAETATTANSNSGNNLQQTVTTTSTGKVHGLVEFRPSYISKIGEMHTEDAVELGYDFNPGTSLFYRQELTTNLYNPGNVSGIDSNAGDGSIRGTLYNLLPLEGTPYTFGYEGRVYLPTMERRRDAGMISTIRNYLWLKYSPTKSFNLYVAEVPVVHLYNQVGTGNTANPIFENKVDMIAEYNFTRNFRASLPIKFSITKYSNYKVGAKYNDAWVNFLQVYPEIMYKLTPNWRVGAAVYTGALTNAGLSELTLEEGFKNSTFQTFVMATL